VDENTLLYKPRTYYCKYRFCLEARSDDHSSITGLYFRAETGDIYCGKTILLKKI